jgi:hypothetical protein
MSGSDEEKKPERPTGEAEPSKREHAGDKPRLTDEQAHAELRRRQRLRDGNR